MTSDHFATAEFEITFTGAAVSGLRYAVDLGEGYEDVALSQLLNAVAAAIRQQADYADMHSLTGGRHYTGVGAGTELGENSPAGEDDLGRDQPTS